MRDATSTATREVGRGEVASLGLGSALEEKGKKSAWAKNKIDKQSESRVSPGHRWAPFAFPI